MIGLNEEVGGYEDDYGPITQEELEAVAEELNEYPNVLGAVIVGEGDELGVGFVKNGYEGEVLVKLREFVEVMEQQIKEAQDNEQI